MHSTFERLTTGCARFAGRPTMLVLCGVFALLALMAFLSGSDRFINGASLALSTLTLLLLPILQATQNRDGAALQAKLDELILSNETARNGLIGLERRPEHEIESMRASDKDLPDVTSPDAA
jgi:low affinity Fe/Cu permease